ncbi:MAG: hypothetical protein DRG82_17030 [Deltaproteobacteria bacterium]|nr:MAG: hypothetical protein DRG82_17030 [Deltaproteobacteria bacterium]
MQLIDISLFLIFLRETVCLLQFFPCKTGSFHLSKTRKGAAEIMRTFFTTIIFSLFLALAFCPACRAASRGDAVSKDSAVLQQREKSSGLSSFLLFGDKSFSPIHVPGTNAGPASTFPDLEAFSPFIDAILSASDLLWTEIAKWNPSPSLSRRQCYERATDTFSGTVDSNNLSAEDRMAISMHHGLGQKKAWNVSLDLGIAIQNDYILLPGDGDLDGLFPKLGMILNDQSEDILDQIRNATPFIGVGISCRF